MGDKTPNTKTHQNLLSGFSPISLPESPAAGSPQKNLTGLPRVVRDLVADTYNSVQRWNNLHINGASIVKELASAKSNDPNNYSEELELSASHLFEIVQNLKQHRERLNVYASQIKATAKLQKRQEPLFISLSLNSIAQLVEDVSQAYDAEFDVKDFVLENIAHARSKEEAMFMAALWTYQYKIPDSINRKLETLLVETGHRKIT